jgi:UTP--glucose-1-phosphate uridylyltransferase
LCADDVIDAPVPRLRQVLDVYEYFGASVMALMEVPKENISAYGMLTRSPWSTTARKTASGPQSGGETGADNAP